MLILKNKLMYCLLIIITIIYSLILLTDNDFIYRISIIKSIDNCKRIEYYQTGVGLNKSYTITLISIYFPSNKNAYEKKIFENMLSSIDQPLIVFTDFSSNSLTFKKRQNLNLPTTIVSYDNLWCLMKQLETSRNRSYINDYVFKMESSSQIALENLKPFVLNLSSSLNIYQSDLFMYLDWDTFKDGPISYWPDISLCLKLLNKLKNSILFGRISKSIVQTKFFVAKQKKINDFAFHFYSLHDKLLHSHFIKWQKRQIYDVFYFHNKNLIVDLNVVNLLDKTLICNNDTTTINYQYLYKFYFEINNYYPCNKKYDKLSLIY